MTLPIATGKYKRRTLARDLIIGLTLAISFVVTVLVITYSIYSAIISQREMNDRMAYITEELAKVLILPLWNVDENMVKQISEGYLKSEYLSGIQVKTDYDDVLFDNFPQDKSKLILREKAIQSENYPLGQVKLLFNRERIEQIHRRMIIVVIMISFSVIFIIITGTHFIMKSLLNKPLDHLIYGIRTIAAGDYQSPLEPVSHSDINAIISEVNIMAGNIAARTEQLQHLNKALGESEKKFRNLFESAPDGILISNLDGKILSFNDAFMKIFKIADKADISGLSVPDLYFDGDKDRPELVKKIMKQKQLENYELDFIDSSGRPFPTSLSLRLIQYGEEPCIQSIIRDITRIKKMEAELRDYAENLEKMVDEKTQELKSANKELAATINSLEKTREQLALNAHQAGMAEVAVSVLHNIGNTVTPVNIRISRLENNFRAKEVQTLGKIYDLLKSEDMWPGMSKTMNERKEKLLSFILTSIDIIKSRNNNFKTDLEIIRKGMDHIMEIIAIQQKYAGLRGFETMVSLNDLIMDAADMLMDSIEKRAVELEFSLGKLPDLHLDKNRMIQIFINIIKNAYESIDMANSENRKQIYLSTSVEEKKYVQAIIADTGAGLSSEHAKDVFKFNFSTKGRGSGFGLHDSANYIRAMGGHMELLSKGPGQGAQVIIKLPVK